MNAALWVVQVLTALAFGQHGYSMLFRVEQARTRMAWTRDVSVPVLRVVDVAEILGANRRDPAFGSRCLAVADDRRGGRPRDRHGARDRVSPHAP